VIEKGCLTELAAVNILRQVVAGYMHLLSCGIVHRDIKLYNIFLSNGVAKLGDFGISDVPCFPFLGFKTLPYSSPESLKEERTD